MEVAVNLGGQLAPRARDRYTTDTIPTVGAGGGVSIISGHPSNGTSGGGSVEYRVWDQASTTGGSPSTICSVAANANVTATGNATGTCWIHARFGRVTNKYDNSLWANVSGAAGITVEAGTQTEFTWGDYSSTTLVVGAGVTASPPAALEALHNRANGRTVSYSESGSCTLSGRGIVTPKADASLSNCVVTATISQAGYDDLTHDYTIAITAGTLVLASTNTNWPTYPDSTLTSGSGTSSIAAPTANPILDDNGVTITWGSYAVESDDGGNGYDSSAVCTMSGSQVVTADGADASRGDKCRVKATASAPGYDDLEVIIHEFTLNGTLDFTSGGTGKPNYSRAPTSGAVLGVTTPGTSQDDNNVDVTWSGWAVTSVDSDGGGVNVCGMGPSGTITVHSLVSSGDTCTVTATASAPGYDDLLNVEIQVLTVP